MGRADQALAEASAAAMWAEDRASQALGIEITEVGPGRATATLTVSDGMVNGHGICHGGYVFVVADTAFAFGCNTYGERTVAAGADVTFTAPVHRGDRLVARCVEVARSGRSGVYDVTVTRDDAVVAVFRGRSRTIGGRLVDQPASS